MLSPGRRRHPRALPPWRLPGIKSESSRAVPNFKLQQRTRPRLPSPTGRLQPHPRPRPKRRQGLPPRAMRNRLNPPRSHLPPPTLKPMVSLPLPPSSYRTLWPNTTAATFPPRPPLPPTLPSGTCITTITTVAIDPSPPRRRDSRPEIAIASTRGAPASERKRM